MPFEAEVVGLGPKGHGLVRRDGRLLFVPETMPGDVVELEGEGKHPRLLRIVRPSPARRPTPCPHDHAGGCGGCDLLFGRFEAIGAAKRQLLADLLAAEGLSDVVPEACVLPGTGLGYRNRARFGVDREGRLTYVRRAAAGKRSARGRLALDDCPVLLPPLEELRRSLDGRCGGLREVEIRAARRGEDLLAILTGEVLPSALRIEEVGASVLWRGPSGDLPLRGHPYLEEEVAGVRLRVSPESFFQGNPDGAETLVRLVREGLGTLDGALAWDLYAGVGLFAMTALAGARKILAVEEAPSSVADLRFNARAHPRVAVRPERTESAVAELERFGERPDVIVADPPREGLGAEAAALLARLRPRRLALVSCDTARGVRDLRALREGGLEIRQVIPVDQFGGTRHLEVVSILEAP